MNMTSSIRSPLVRDLRSRFAIRKGVVVLRYTDFDVAGISIRQNEHFGIVPLEAMAARKAVIACDSGGPRESMQNESTGFLCKAEAREFAGAMGVLLTQPSRANVMGKAARRHVERQFSRGRFGELLEEILEEMVGRKARKGV